MALAETIAEDKPAFPQKVDSHAAALLLIKRRQIGNLDSLKLAVQQFVERQRSPAAFAHGDHNFTDIVAARYFTNGFGR